MKSEILLQNIVNIFIISLVLNAAIMAIFSMAAIKNLPAIRSIEATRDLIIVLLSLFLCYHVEALRIFRGTGIAIPFILDIIISGLVLASMINFVRHFLSRMKAGGREE